MNAERAANLSSMIATLFAGLLFIIQGFKFISLKAQRPELPRKVYLLATICFIVGFVDIFVGIAHLYI
jgi:uncharacterized membrane protein YfcA